MDSDKKYQSIPIPKRENNNNNLKAEKPLSIKGEFHLRTNFATIDINIDSTAKKDESIPVKTSDDPIRSRFYAMKQIAKKQMLAFLDNAQIFYEQGIFMEDFEDHYTGLEPFSYYYPHYQVMDNRQLRTYFSWRTKVRNGNITNTLLPYAYLYVYELINNIGVHSPEDGFLKLVSFFKSFRKYNSSINSNFSRWLKDYFVYYQIPGNFYDFIKEHNLTALYSPTFRYELIRENPFKYYCEISKYNILQSKFYLDKNEKLTENCFNYLYSMLKEEFLSKGKSLEDFIFYSLAKERSWSPFSNALFFPRLKHEDKEITLTLGESYTCRYNQFYCSTATLSDNGKQLAAYILKEMEVNLREIKRYKRKITSNPHLCDNTLWEELSSMGINLKTSIKQNVYRFHQILHLKPVMIDKSKLSKIRTDALFVQEKLTVEEEIVPAPSVNVKPIIPEKNITSTNNIWHEFFVSLDDVEIQILRRILRYESFDDIIKEQNIMPEIPLDSINEKAMDVLSDTIFEIDGEVTVYDDYKENLLEMIETYGK